MPPRLLERDGELAEIEAAIAATFTSTGSFVAIEGSAGAGKTSMLWAVRERARAAGVQVLSGRAGELEREFSYGLVRQLFEPLLARSSREALTNGAAALAGPLFGDRPLAGSAVSGRDSSFAIRHGLFWLTVNLAAHRPLLLAMDDLHWSDVSSLRWLSHLVRRIEGLPVVVVAGLRPDEPGVDLGLLGEVLADPTARIRRLAPLGRESVAEILREALSGDADDEFCAACHDATGGNPLLLRELSTTLAGKGVSPTADQAHRVRVIAPRGVSRSVRLRLSRLPREAVALARAVAILGDRVEPSHAADLAGVEREVAARMATTLGRADLLCLETPLSYVHPVVRDTVYLDVAPAEREQRHAEAARVMAAAGAAAEQVAAHVLLAPRTGDAFAVTVLREAARASLAQGAPEAAVAYLRRALTEPPRVEERGDVLLDLGLAERFVDVAAAADHLSAALGLLDEPCKRGAVALELGRTLFLTGRIEEAIDVVQGAIAELAADGSDLLRQLEAELASLAMLDPSRHPLARERLERTTGTDRADGVGGRMLLALLAYSECCRVGELAPCVAMAERALTGGLLLGEDNCAAFAYAATVLVAADRFEAAASLYEHTLADARARGSISSFAIASCFRGCLANLRGSLADAEADTRAALEAGAAQGMATGLKLFGIAFLADALMERGELDRADGVLGRVPAAAFGGVPLFLESRGRLRLLEGRTREGLADLLEAGRRHAAIRRANPAMVGWRYVAALAHHRLGQRDEAVQLASQELGMARAWGAPRALGRALRVAGSIEAGEAGLTLLRESLATLESSPARLERAKTLVELGAALRRARRRAEAREPLRRGFELAEACGATPLAQRARVELRAAGARPRRPARSGLDALTPSERRVAAMAADGLMNRDIAQALFVTPKTIEVHLSSTYRKLGIRSRAKLPAALAARD